MKYQELADKTEAELLKQIKIAYIEAYRKATKELQHYQDLIDNMHELERRLPKDYTEEQKKRWRLGFFILHLRFKKIQDNVQQFFNESGELTSELIQDTLPEYYRMSRDFAIGNINAKANVNFATLTENQIATIIKNEQPVFSKIAFNNLGKNKKATDMLRNEMLQAVLLGESQDKLARRIKRVAGYQYNYQAMRTAQTERTRVQSQAGQRAAEEAQAIGVKMTKRWSATMVRTRDTHQHLHGQTIPIDKDFELSDGDKLNYPGDPNGRPENIINCRCRLIYEVADEGSKNNIKDTDKTIPTKYGGSTGAKKTVGWQERHAKRYYEEVRNRKPYVDAEKIAKHTNFTVEQIEEIRQHLFIKEHLLDGKMQRFAPDYYQSVTWQRLCSWGNVTETDLVFLKHEYYELTLMKEKGYNYTEAHDITNKIYNWWQRYKKENGVDE